ncbi:hypothetical protein U9M48_034608 [Paspalum notatum var. saurae]|uniref:Ubiquitin-like protease family profile domain-containing protein n=1 Tax=Paspalum notatum var. saurae TaxID=547442 RepID=A0AAQ3UAC0_PASNO
MSPELHRGEGALVTGGAPKQALMSSPLIELVESFLYFCKAQVICYTKKKMCLSCQSICTKFAFDVLKIVFEAVGQKDACIGVKSNYAHPIFSDTVIMFEANEQSEGCPVSNAASVKDNAKSPTDVLGAKGKRDGNGNGSGVIHANSSKYQKITSTDYAPIGAKNLAKYSAPGEGAFPLCFQLKKGTLKSQQAVMMDEMYNEMNLQAEKPKIINNNAENQLHISSTINNVDDTSTEKATHVTYVGFCHKHFEECHPRSSKKHFFYPKVGHSMMNHSREGNANVLQTCFFGANSAYKLRLSDKLYFSVCHLNHWFVFIVDLKHSCYVFLDSYYNEGDYYQQEVSSALIQGFETAWDLYAGAGSTIDLSRFRILYPPVPKQTTNNDCGIFMLKFMEYWDFAVDMKLKFSQEDIPKIRIQLAHELYFSDKNTEDKSLVNNLYKQGIDPRIIN